VLELSCSFPLNDFETKKIHWAGTPSSSVMHSLKRRSGKKRMSEDIPLHPIRSYFNISIFCSVSIVLVRHLPQRKSSSSATSWLPLQVKVFNARRTGSDSFYVPVLKTPILHELQYTRVYPKVSGLAAWSENYKWYSSLPLGAVVSLFCESF
jgi:hypothetical protein